MVFGYDVPVKFSIEGACKTASVHLSGYFQPGPDDDEEDDDEDGDDDGTSEAFANRKRMLVYLNILIQCTFVLLVFYN